MRSTRALRTSAALRTRQPDWTNGTDWPGWTDGASGTDWPHWPDWSDCAPWTDWPDWPDWTSDALNARRSDGSGRSRRASIALRAGLPARADDALRPGRTSWTDEPDWTNGAGRPDRTHRPCDARETRQPVAHHDQPAVFRREEGRTSGRTARVTRVDPRQGDRGTCGACGPRDDASVEHQHAPFRALRTRRPLRADSPGETRSACRARQPHRPNRADEAVRSLRTNRTWKPGRPLRTRRTLWARWPLNFAIAAGGQRGDCNRERGGKAKTHD